MSSSRWSRCTPAALAIGVACRRSRYSRRRPGSHHSTRSPSQPDSSPGGPSQQYTDGRYYDPNTAQFLSVDPLVNITGAPYSYAGDNPLNGTDPTGLDCTNTNSCPGGTAYSENGGSWVDPSLQSSGSTTDQGIATVLAGGLNSGTLASSSQDNSGGSWGAAVLGGASSAISGSGKASENFVEHAASNAAEGSAERSSLEGLDASIARVGYAFDGFSGALSVTVDYANHLSVGEIFGHAIGGEVGVLTGGFVGGLVCSESGPGAVICVVGLSGAFGAGGAYVGGWLGKQAEQWIKSW